MLVLVVRMLYLFLPVVLLGLEHVLVYAFIYAIKHYFVPLLFQQLLDILCHLCITNSSVVTLFSLMVDEVIKPQISVR